MGDPAPQLASLLAERTRVTEVVSCKVAGNLQVLTVPLILNKAMAAPTLLSESLKATLKIVSSTNRCTSVMREPWGYAVPPEESIPKHIEASVRQAAVCKSSWSGCKPLNITTIQHTWCYASKKTHFDVAAAELVVAAEAGEHPRVPALPRRCGCPERLAHNDGDSIGAALGCLRRRWRRRLVELLAAGAGAAAARWQEGAGLLVAVVGVVGRAHGVSRGGEGRTRRDARRGE